MKYIRILALLFLLLDGCIDPLVVKLPNQQPSLVVDGLITDAPGPYQVRLFTSSKLDTTTLKRPAYETGASVWIVDDSGQSELLSEIAPGVYETSETGIRGEVGKTYYVRIVTARKTEYRSTSQVLLGAGEIDDLRVVFNRDALPAPKGTELLDAFSILIDAHGTEASNLLRWRWKNTYKGKTFPERRVKNTVAGPEPDPEPCSGYISNGGGISQVGPCTCCICWTSEVSTRSNISDNRFSKDVNFKDVQIGILPITAMRFYERYYISVDQLCVSEEVYQFWKLVRAQELATGSLFQPNVVRVKGNITCVTDPNKEALGIFSVSGITTKTLFVDRSEVPFEIAPLDTIMYNCMEGLPGGGTTDKPPFW